MAYLKVLFCFVNDGQRIAISGGLFNIEGKNTTIF